MEEITCKETHNWHTFIEVLGIMVMAILMLVSIASAAPFAYISNINDNTVSVIDIVSNNVIATIPVGVHPLGVAVSLDGKRAYVSNEHSHDVSVIDTATSTVIATVPVDLVPWGIAVTPNGKKVYVANCNDSDTYFGNTISVIDTSTKNVIKSVHVGNNPRGVAITPDGKKVYVTMQQVDSFGDRDVYVIDTATDNVTAVIINLEFNPWGIAIKPDGTVAYVTNAGSNTVSLIDTNSDNVIRLLPNYPPLTIPVGRLPVGVAINPSGTKLYVTNYYDNTVSVIDTDTNTVIATVSVGRGPYGVAVTRDETKVYVANLFSNNISIIDTVTNSVIASLNVSSPVAFGQFIGETNPVKPIANFTFNTTQGYVPLTVQFTDKSENSTSLFWDFGDGNNATTKNPLHTFFFANNYTVNLTAKNGNGMNSKLVTINVINSPNALAADFSASPSSGSVPLFVNFTDKSSGSPNSWKWTFGDGSTSTAQNPEHTYNKTGLYSVTLTASKTGSSNSVTKSSYIAVSRGYEAPIAAFSATPNSGSVPLTVSFTDQSTGSPTSWKWTFGDGNISTDKNPVHTYNKTGQFTVALTASNANGSNTVTKTSYITVTNNLNAPIANFSASSYSGKVPLTVSFTDKSSGSITSWKWTFGDGNNSTQQNPVYTYNKTGKFNVALTISNAAGSNTVTKYSCVNVTTASGTVVPNPVRIVPLTAFSSTPTTGSVPLTVSFADQSTGSPTSWRWSFGDGVTSADKNPVHVYNKTGQFSVTLTASNANGTNALTKTSYVVISSSSNVPVTNFSASPTSGSVPLTVSFTDKISGSVTSWKWSFGDGGNSSVQNPVYNYNKAGLYSVTLTTTNAAGTNALTKTSYIAVSNSSKNPVAAFSASPVSGSVPLSVSFTDKSSGSPTSWKWTFGDGNTSTQQNPVYKYNKTGSFTVGLTVTNPGGSCTESMTGYITVR